MWRLGALIVLLAVPHAGAQEVLDAPACRAHRQGQDLITKVVYPDGYIVEGPWRVTSQQSRHGAPTVTAVLDHIVEIRPSTREQQVTQLPGAIEMTFRGKSQNELLNEAARVWCMTVLRARSQLPNLRGDHVGSPHTIMP